MKNEQISGEKLFFRYAYPCGEGRYHRGLISVRELDELHHLVNTDGEPTRDLLQGCFAEAFPAFCAFFGIDPSDDRPWPVEVVRQFWRQHTGRVPSCAVMFGKIEKIIPSLSFICLVNFAGKTKPVFNRYRLPVAVGDTVFFHQHIIAEVEKANFKTNLERPA